jgi:malonate decarboxylase gamma subunit
MRTYQTVLTALFTSHTVHEHANVIWGSGQINDYFFHILGVREQTSFGVEQALIFAEKCLELLVLNDKQPIFLLVDVIGQSLTKRDEWLAMHQYFAHTIQCLDMIRQQGHRLCSLIYNKAIGGAFIAYGLMADKIFALPDAQVAVMWLEGMSKVTKIDLETLRALSKSSPIFAPGVANFYQLGGVHEVVALEDMPKALCAEHALHDTEDRRAYLGHKRGGRKLAYTVMQKVMADA